MLISLILQVSFQLNIIATAFFAVIILRQKLLLTQWGSLYFSIAGISIIQLSDQREMSIDSLHQNRLMGFAAALAGSILSGFTSVYFEKMLKGADISVWMRNLQMSLISIPLSIGACLASDFNDIQSKGFFHGYDWYVVYLILLLACRGLLIGLVMKYADNILRGFATSISIIISCIASVYLFGFHLTIQFVIGVMVVIGSIGLYGHIPKPLETENLSKNLDKKDIEREPEICIENGDKLGTSAVYVIKI